jgi:hypothetical protein
MTCKGLIWTTCLSDELLEVGIQSVGNGREYHLRGDRISRGPEPTSE